MSPREEARRAGALQVSGLVFGFLHLAFSSGRLATEQGRGGVTLLVGCAFITLVLWAMLTLRSLAADKPLGPELVDGLTAGAVTAWVLAVVPPRAANFLEQDAADDFARAYLPVALLVVLVVLGAQALWPRRAPSLVGVRFFASLAVAFWLLAGLLVFVSGGEDARGHGLRALGAGGLAALAAVAQWRRSTSALP